MIIIGFDDYAPQCRGPADALGMALEFARVRRFADGESLVRLPEALPEQVVLCRKPGPAQRQAGRTAAGRPRGWIVSPA